MARQQQRNGSTLDAQSGASILDRVLTFFKQEKTIRRKHSVDSNLETGMRFDLDAADGNAYFQWHQLISPDGSINLHQQVLMPDQLTLTAPPKRGGYNPSMTAYGTFRKVGF